MRGVRIKLSQTVKNESESGSRVIVLASSHSVGVSSVNEYLHI